MSERRYAARSGRPQARGLTFVVVAATALVLSFPPPQHSDQPIKLFPDSVTYLEWSHGRPPTPSLFYVLVGSGRAACIVQTALSVLCWTALGWSALGVAGAVFAAALAASLPVALWNFTVLSEPLTLSLGAALCAATLVLGRRWTWPRFALWAACALAFNGVRVENFVVVPIFTAALLVWHRARWPPLAAIGAVAAAMFVVFGIVLDKQTTNWQTRMTNVVLTRILPDPKLAAEFHARGLPQEASLLPYQNRLLSYYNAEFRAQTPAFQHWLDEDSRGTYVRWLATAAPHRLLTEWMDSIMLRITNDYYIGGVVLPASANALIPFYDAVRLNFRFWYWLALVPVLCAALTLSVRFVDVFVLAYLAAVYVLAFAAFHGDTGELERHMVLAAAFYRMAPVIALGCVWERVAGPLGRLWRRASAHS
jgi:hypothetical protein